MAVPGRICLGKLGFSVAGLGDLGKPGPRNSDSRKRLQSTPKTLMSAPKLPTTRTPLHSRQQLSYLIAVYHILGYLMTFSPLTLHLQRILCCNVAIATPSAQFFSFWLFHFRSYNRIYFGSGRKRRRADIAGCHFPVFVLLQRR